MGRNIAAGLAQIAEAFNGLNKHFQLSRIAKELGPEYAGVTDPDVLKLIFEKKRLDREDRRAADLSELYGAQTLLANAKAGNVGKVGPGGGTVTYDYFTDPTTGEIKAIPKKVKQGEAPKAINVDLPLGAAKTGTKATKIPAPEKPGLLQQLGSFFSGGGSASQPRVYNPATGKVE